MKRNTRIFDPQTFRFFRELGRNNRKEWMDANRERYRASIVEPFRRLLDALAPAALKLNPDFEIGGRTGKNFSRINRDIRFAADKSPYRTQMYLFFSDRRVEEGDPSASLPSTALRAGRAGDGQLYVGLSADAVTAGFRMYGMGRASRMAQLAVPRAMENGVWLERQKRRLSRKYESYWYATHKGEWTKRKGWPTTPEEWKRLKGWIVRRKMSPAAATRPGFVREVSRVFRELFPLYEFTSAPRWRS